MSNGWTENKSQTESESDDLIFTGLYGHDFTLFALEKKNTSFFLPCLERRCLPICDFGPYSLAHLAPTHHSMAQPWQFKANLSPECTMGQSRPVMKRVLVLTLWITRSKVTDQHSCGVQNHSPVHRVWGQTQTEWHSFCVRRVSLMTVDFQNVTSSDSEWETKRNVLSSSCSTDNLLLTTPKMFLSYAQFVIYHTQQVFVSCAVCKINFQATKMSINNIDSDVISSF